MDLDDLRSSVTDAILRAESLPAATWEAESAFRDVSDLEEAIATVTSAKDVEGEIARLGAVAAALSAGEPLRAIQLAERYLEDELSDGARTTLQELQNKANAEIERTASEEPSVEPIRFHLRAA